MISNDSRDSSCICSVSKYFHFASWRISLHELSSVDIIKEAEK